MYHSHRLPQNAAFCTAFHYPNTQEPQIKPENEETMLYENHIYDTNHQFNNPSAGQDDILEVFNEIVTVVVGTKSNKAATFDVLKHYLCGVSLFFKFVLDSDCSASFPK